jgi:drug/metabolite transporter (DMT)-like permease
MTPSRIQGTDPRSAALGLLVLSSILWGSSFVSVKIGLEYVDPYDFAFLRLAFAAPVLLVVLLLRKRFRFAVLKQKSVWFLGILNSGGFVLQYVGLKFTTAAKTALLIDLNVLIVAILSWWLFQESFGKRKQIGVFLGVLGAVMVTTNGDLSSLTSGQLLGDVLVFSAGLAWALFIVLHKQILLEKDQDAIQLSAVVMIATALLLLPAAVFLGGFPWSSIPVQGWQLVAYTAIACTVLPYAMWVVALKAVTATVATVVGMLEIVAAMVMSSFFLGEVYNTTTLIGALIVLVALFAVAES